jgi:hypothetical protein
MYVCVFLCDNWSRNEPAELCVCVWMCLCMFLCDNWRRNEPTKLCIWVCMYVCMYILVRQLKQKRARALYMSVGICCKHWQYYACTRTYTHAYIEACNNLYSHCLSWRQTHTYLAVHVHRENNVPALTYTHKNAHKACNHSCSPSYEVKVDAMAFNDIHTYTHTGIRAHISKTSWRRTPWHLMTYTHTHTHAYKHTFQRL